MEELAPHPLRGPSYASEFPLPQPRSWTSGTPRGGDLASRGERRDTLAGAAGGRSRRGARTLGLVNVVGFGPSLGKWTGGLPAAPAPRSGSRRTKAFTSQIAALSRSSRSRWAGCARCPSCQGARVVRGARPATGAGGAGVGPRRRRVERIAERMNAGEQRPLPRPRATTFRWARWRARSSSRRSPTSTAEGYPAAEMKHGPIALIDRSDAGRLPRAEGRRLPEGGVPKRGRGEGPRRPG